MASTLALLNGLLPIGYLVAMLAYLSFFVRQEPRLARAATAITWGVVTIHAVYLVMSGIEYEHIPLASTWESLTVTAFALTLVYLIIEWQMRERSTGVFVLSGALVLQLLSTAFIRHTGEVPDILRSPMFGIHVSTALLGYVALAVSALYGLMYLIQYRQLKQRHVGLLFQRLPNLETLSRMNVRALAIGWIGLTVAILAGTVWAYTLARTGQLQVNLLQDAKFLLTVGLWVVYGACLGGLYMTRWSKHTFAAVSVVAFLLMLGSSLVVTLLFPSFHDFT